MAGYEITLADFRRLLADATWRTEVAPLLAEWFGCQVAGAGDRTVVLDQARQPVDIRELHAAIQAVPDRQGRLYRTAMSLWR